MHSSDDTRDSWGERPWGGGGHRGRRHFDADGPWGAGPHHGWGPPPGERRGPRGRRGGFGRLDDPDYGQAIASLMGAVRAGATASPAQRQEISRILHHAARAAFAVLAADPPAQAADAQNPPAPSAGADGIPA